MPADGLDLETALDIRLNYLAKSCQLHFDKEPLKIERARAQFLYSDDGTEYLDCVSNIAHVGHCHPRVVHAAQVQMSKLMACTADSSVTDSAQLSDQLAHELRATLPPQLSVLFFTPSGSEANDLAVTLARAYTGHSDVVVVDGAFHGALGLAADFSPRVFRKANRAKPIWTHIIPCPDTYRGPYRESDPVAGDKYVRDAINVVNRSIDSGRQIACFVTEPVCSLQGVVVPPKGWMSAFADYVRHIGGLVIVDEVQTGFGRCGEYYWCFQSQDIVPDILTLGKPIGNGYPMGVVATTPEIARALPEYLCPRNYVCPPVAAAVAISVLQIIRVERLLSAAASVGRFLKEGLLKLQRLYDTLGLVRGFGMMLGVEIVTDRLTRKPNSELAKQLVYRLKNDKVIVGLEGESKNVLLLLPPLCFTKDNVQRLLTALERALKGGNLEVPDDDKFTLEDVFPGSSRDLDLARNSPVNEFYEEMD